MAARAQPTEHRKALAVSLVEMPPHTHHIVATETEAFVKGERRDVVGADEQVQFGQPRS
jgi:hypothetical protein